MLGIPDAPVTVTEYVDLQCPICAEASKQTLPTLIDDYVKTGKVKLQARTLSFLGPDSIRAAKVAAGAEQQGRLWAFLETFYASQGPENSGYVTDDFLREVAAAAGVDADAGARLRRHADRAAGARARRRRRRPRSRPTRRRRSRSSAAMVLRRSSPSASTDLRAALDKELAR